MQHYSGCSSARPRWVDRRRLPAFASFCAFLLADLEATTLASNFDTNTLYQASTPNFLNLTAHCEHSPFHHSSIHVSDGLGPALPSYRYGLRGRALISAIATTRITSSASAPSYSLTPHGLLLLGGPCRTPGTKGTEADFMHWTQTIHPAPSDVVANETGWPSTVQFFPPGGATAPRGIQTFFQPSWRPRVLFRGLRAQTANYNGRPQDWLSRPPRTHHLMSFCFVLTSQCNRLDSSAVG